MKTSNQELYNSIKKRDKEIKSLKEENAKIKKDYSDLENKYFDLANKYEDLEIANIIEERKDCTKTYTFDEVKKMIDDRLNEDI